MNWRNVQLIWRREIRDQLRDRRTLLVIGVLPLLIYPMMGIVFLRASQFIQQHDARVTVIGAEHFKESGDLPPLLEGDRFSGALFSDASQIDRISVNRLPSSPSNIKNVRHLLAAGEIDVVVEFPPGFAESLDALRQTIEGRVGEIPLSARPPPRPVILYDSTRDESKLAQTRVQILLDRWEGKIIRGNLEAGAMPIEVTQPFVIEPVNVATDQRRQAVIWSKLLPFIVFICALTGAFYPAVDLVAGEKERGTLETLLTSPAQRNEIVWGKLLTVITFSIGSALCNLGSIALTGRLIVQQLKSLGPMSGVEALEPPSLLSMVWLLLALVPMAALFSAASLALAALARSTKEGQYYLMPMFLVCMPLMLMSLTPGFELNLGTSLIPITGMVLLVQAAMEGDLLLAGRYLLPVALVTGACGLISIRWAVDQFKQESILFRDTENVGLIAWARYAYRHRPATPSLAAALVCVVFIFLSQFGVQSLGFGMSTTGDFVKMVLASQASILLPVLLLTWLCVRQPRRTFLLSGSLPFGTIALAVLLAVALVPVGTRLMERLLDLFPLPASFLEFAQRLEESTSGTALSLGGALLLMAVLPAICEELAFRGFILSGIRSRISVGLAVVLSSIFFGLAHSTAVHQTISATLLGLVLGALAVKTEHISPCIAFHMSYNGLQLLRSQFASTLTDADPGGLFFRATGSPVVGVSFTAPAVAASGLVAFLLLWQIGRLSHWRLGQQRPDRPLSDITEKTEGPHLTATTPVEKSRA